MKILLDTNAYSAMVRGNRAIREFIVSAKWILLPAFVLGELEYGFRGGSRFTENHADLLKFLSMPGVRVVQTTPNTAWRYGELKDSLRKAGKPIPENDVWIGAMALEHDLPVLSLDGHFETLESFGVQRLKIQFES